MKVKGFDNVESVTHGDQHHIYIDDEHIGLVLKKEKEWKPIYSDRPGYIMPLQSTRTKKDAIEALINRHAQ